MKKKQKHWSKSLLLWLSNILGILIFLPFLLIFIANQIISVSSDGYIYDSIEFIPYNKVGLVLGTSHRIRDGGPNPYFFNRMEAAATLYHHGKISYIIASGDNRTRWYNEPEQMRKELKRLGIPDSVIYLDFAGLRTLDSVIRCRKVFGQNNFTIISQKFHNQRAVYIAKQHDMNVVAFNAQDIENAQRSQTRVREWFAKANVFMDQITKKQPRYTGERVIIGNE